jgi:hypothetical protein
LVETPHSLVQPLNGEVAFNRRVTVRRGQRSTT